MEAALEAGAEDVVEAGDSHRRRDVAGLARRGRAGALPPKGFAAAESSVSMEPSTTVRLEGEHAETMLRWPTRSTTSTTCRTSTRTSTSPTRRCSGSRGSFASMLARGHPPRVETSSRSSRLPARVCVDTDIERQRDRGRGLAAAADARRRPRLAGDRLRRDRPRRRGAALGLARRAPPDALGIARAAAGSLHARSSAT